MSNMIGNLLYVAICVLFLYSIVILMLQMSPFISIKTFVSYESIIFGILKVLLTIVGMLSLLWVWK